jgi:HlyD family secretion protein
MRLPLSLVCALLIGCGGVVEVGVAQPQRKPIQESFSEPARTRLAKRYSVSMPVDARIGRIELEAGDVVKKGQVLVSVDDLPFKQAVAEARAAVAELEARIKVNEDDRMERTAQEDLRHTVGAGQEALKSAKAQVAAERARLDRAEVERKRVEALAAKEAVTQRDLDDVRLRAETALIELRKQEFQSAATGMLLAALRLGPRFVEERVAKKRLEREALLHQHAQAKARLAVADHRLKLVTTVQSPIDGVVLTRHSQGEAPVSAGQPLLVLGDLSKLEVVAEVLTPDALRLKPGGVVELDPGGGRPVFSGQVVRVEPAGFTKLSSLGVEQQRVRVIVKPEAPPAGLGAGFRVQARFVTGIKEGALVVPRFSVLQAPDRSFYAFVIKAGALERRTLEIGLRSDQELEVLSGLAEGDRLVATPDATFEAGRKVTEAKAAAN